MSRYKGTIFFWDGMLIHTLLALSLAIIVELDDNKKTCYRHFVEKNYGLSVTFYVVNGGDIQIASEFASPTGGVVHTTGAMRTYSYTYDIPVAGYYTLCFDNTNGPRKEVAVFYYYVRKDKTSAADTGANINQWLSETIDRMVEASNSFRFTQVTESGLLVILSRIKATLTFWTIAKCITVLGCAAYQVVQFKRFFSRRRTAV